MDIVYKYLPLMPLDYIDNPTIKLSQPKSLNDPFESNPCENIYESIKSLRLSLGFTNEEAEEHAEEYKETIKNTLTLNGIVAFSETPRNSLMWSHYGDQHNGMCIGFKKNLLENIDVHECTHKVSILTPQKINYDNLRIESNYTPKDIENELTEIINRHLFTKSDEWIYEKEHRCVVPLSATTKIKLTDENATYTTENQTKLKVKLIFDRFQENEIINKTEQDNIYKPNLDKVHNGIYYVLSECGKSVIFLVDVDPSHIDSIYLGCKVTDEYAQQLLHKIKESNNKDIKLFKFDISKFRFELISKRVEPTI